MELFIGQVMVLLLVITAFAVMTGGPGTAKRFWRWLWRNVVIRPLRWGGRQLWRAIQNGFRQLWHVITN